MAYKYTLAVRAEGKKQREVKIIAKDDKDLKRSLALLEPNTKIAIIKKTKVKYPS